MSFLNDKLVQLYTWRYRLADEEGASGVEYGILVAAIAAVIVAVAFLIGDEILKAFNKVLTELQ